MYANQIFDNLSMIDRNNILFFEKDEKFKFKQSE